MSNTKKHLALITLKGKESSPIGVDLGGLKIDLKNVALAAVGSKIVLGVRLDADIAFSGLPLVGKFFSSESGFGIKNLQLLLSSQDFDANEIATLNSKMPQGLQKIPVGALIKKGPNFFADIQLGGAPKPMAIPPPPPPPASTQRITSPPLRPGAVWLTVNKTVGPLTFKRVGGQFYNDELNILLDAAMALGPLTLSLEGLSVGTPLNAFKPTFGLDGLGLSFSKPPIGISGAFLRQRDADGADSYAGMATRQMVLWVGSRATDASSPVAAILAFKGLSRLEAM